ncbi:RTA1-domain-containing protein [Eremomyces bilateralis CBS 781.70]|uniref:RTA1-domain-containing protein n=1 Tax=Eremomyces bilateralis CBS 781.70 TaxID=1392243 RepID=A0A6G1FV75_9PEZI|nr:RTA1-domain-containing protein [Eremomyces bilateralis CBS 781.70]KAF1809549.1 RTA1-domain-containing protein [Eremomyces bilateralis CBS 781.70]
MTSNIFARREGHDTSLVDFEYYHYEPNLAAAIIFTVVFFVLTAWHSFQMIRTRTWFFVPFVLGVLMEAVGYVGRTVSATQENGEWTLGPYLIQTLFVLVAPAFLAASIYMELGRIVLMVDGESHLFVRRTWMTKIFVTGDVLSFCMQGAGGGLLAVADTQKSVDAGSNIIVGGLFIQIIFFGLFVIAGALFHFRLRKVPTQLAHVMPWQKHMGALYATSLLIFVRSIFRVIEYLQGFNGYLLSKEVYLYVFDSLLIAAAVVVMNLIHPSEIGRLLKGGGGSRIQLDPMA